MAGRNQLINGLGSPHTNVGRFSPHCQANVKLYAHNSTGPRFQVCPRDRGRLHSGVGKGSLAAVPHRRSGPGGTRYWADAGCPLCPPGHVMALPPSGSMPIRHGLLWLVRNSSAGMAGRTDSPDRAGSPRPAKTRTGLRFPLPPRRPPDSYPPPCQ